MLWRLLSMRIRESATGGGGGKAASVEASFLPPAFLRKPWRRTCDHNAVPAHAVI
jgi:hypothetical protein